MYVYVYNQRENFYTVGFYDPQGKWHAESDQNTSEEAAARVAYLNGGVLRNALSKACGDDSEMVNAYIESQVLES